MESAAPLPPDITITLRTQMNPPSPVASQTNQGQDITVPELDHRLPTLTELIQAEIANGEVVSTSRLFSPSSTPMGFIEGEITDADVVSPSPARGKSSKIMTFVGEDGITTSPGRSLVTYGKRAAQAIPPQDMPLAHWQELPAVNIPAPSHFMAQVGRENAAAAAAAASNPLLRLALETLPSQDFRLTLLADLDPSDSNETPRGQWQPVSDTADQQLP